MSTTGDLSDAILAVEMQILDKFSEKCHSRHKLETAIMKYFKYFDLDNSGCLDFPTFARAIERFAVGVNAVIVKHIYDRYAEDVNVLNYAVFAVDLVTGEKRRSEGLL
jgi:hypothetical protein